jgi:2-polyprenyl-3-methyl-5-hydroxy-6-metoxy-1,4-benzoquinol methylase
MVKYFLTASILKAFSATPGTRALYRRIGNVVGARGRAHGTMPPYYAAGVRRMLELTDKHSLFKDGQRILEVGTGWMHWEALTMALFYDIEAVLFDVWDNRQMIALKNYISQFAEIIEQWGGVSSERRKRAQKLIQQVLQVTSFEELYQLLDFKYMVVSNGSLENLTKNSFDVVVSARVLEHIGRDSADQFARDCCRVLKPGGFSLQSICIGDHLYAYDRSTSPKQYLAFSESTWRNWFENQVQYINRIQRSEWLQVFQQAGLQLVECESTSVNVDSLKLANEYKHLSQSDLECHTLKMLHQKPISARPD